MEHESYKESMKKLIQSFMFSYNSNYLFVKHYDTLTVKKQEIYDLVVDDEYNYCLMYYKFPMHDMLEPYAPFLGWIREIYYLYFRNETPEEFVRRAKVYPLQQEVFAEYIKTGRAFRTEDLIITETKYEKKRVMDSIVSILTYVGEKKKIFMFIESMHLINASGAELLYKMISRNIPHIHIMGMYNEVYHTFDYISPKWKKLADEIIKQNLQYELGGVSTESTIDAQDVFIPREEKIDEYIGCAANMFYFLAFEDAQHYLSILYEKVEQDVISISNQTYVYLLELLALVKIFCEEYSRAMQLCERAYELGKNFDENINYNYNYISALAQIGMEQVENKASIYIERCRTEARKKEDELAEYKADVILLLSNYNYWRDINLNQYTYKVSDKFYQQTKKFNFLNILAHICIYCYENDDDSIDAFIRGEKKQVYFQEGVDVATRIENWDILTSAYTKNIILFSNRGNYTLIDEMYRKKLEIIQKDGNKTRMVHAYNGMGYNAGIAEQYQKADEYFSKSLVECLELKDGMETAITLYNSAVNKMQAREFFGAAEELNLLIQVMDLLEIHSINICETSKIYAMLSYCSFQMGEEYQCYLCLNRVEAYVNHLDYVDEPDKYRYWHGTLFLKHIVLAMIATKENRLEDAKKNFELADFHQQRDLKFYHFNYMIYVLELANYYEVCGLKEERNNALKAGAQYCSKQGYYHKENILLSQMQGRFEIGKRPTLGKRTLTNKEILSVIENMAVEKRLEDSKRDIGFLTVWQELLNNNMNTNDMMSQAVALMKNHFNLDGVMILDTSGRVTRVAYFDAPTEVEHDANVTRRAKHFTELELEKIVAYFEKNKHALLTNRIDKGFLEYKELLELFDIHHIITLFAMPMNNEEGKLSCIIIGYVEMRNNLIGNRYLLKEHDFVIMKFVSQQLYVAIEKLNYLDLIRRMNSQLSDMAVTDLLTGLYNRQGFEKRMAEDQKKDQDEQNVIVYLDLDNFKYYNDTFGHEIGDYVLVRFAQILEKVVDDIGYAVRYGGDEFVLVLNGKNVEFAKKIAKNIFYMLADGMSIEIERKLGYPIMIPTDKKLSCSIGIAACHGYSMEKITEALNKADKGLYHVKKTTKNNYVVWDELKKA